MLQIPAGPEPAPTRVRAVARAIYIADSIDADGAVNWDAQKVGAPYVSEYLALARAALMADPGPAAEAERDAARTGLARVRDLTARHRSVEQHNEMVPITDIADLIRTPTSADYLAALDGTGAHAPTPAPAPTGTKWYAACWHHDNGAIEPLAPETVMREHAEAQVQELRAAERDSPNGQPDRIVLAVKLHQPWRPVDGGEGA
ncbi:hypothetical protein ACXR2T_08015 [Leucobacter sp. HY1910]